ncbi:MAG TPA: MFS transporter [Blastocatellia bacterium]|nr:MFS transporter [Blastocatellia bacterium]
MNSTSKTTITLLSFGHLVLDSYSSFLVPILPLLAFKLGITPAQAGFLIPVMMISSSLMQPVYGIISDRYFKRAFAVAGPMIAAVFISSIGLANSLPMLLALTIAGGIGIGAFHPQSAALAHRAATDWNPARQGTVMSIFSSAGTVGYALGPLIISTCVAWFGLENSYYTMVFGIAASVLLWFYCPALEKQKRADDAPRLSQLLKDARVPLTILYFAVVLRSAASVSIQSYLPFWLKDHGLDLQLSSLVITGFIFFGGIGGFFGGALADRFGARRVSMVSVLIATPLLFAGFLTHGALSYVLIMLGGLCLNLPLPISVVMAQRLVPGGASTVSALVMGFAWGLGALLTPVTGKLSEGLGLTKALLIVALWPLASAFLFWRYPKDEIIAREAVEATPQEAYASGD